jgi:hypothetical protein
LIGDIIRTVAVTPTLGSVAVHSTQAWHATSRSLRRSVPRNEAVNKIEFLCGLNVFDSTLLTVPRKPTMAALYPGITGRTVVG